MTCILHLGRITLKMTATVSVMTGDAYGRYDRDYLRVESRSQLKQARYSILSVYHCLGTSHKVTISSPIDPNVKTHLASA